MASFSTSAQSWANNNFYLSKGCVNVLLAIASELSSVKSWAKSIYLGMVSKPVLVATCIFNSSASAMSWAKVNFYLPKGMVSKAALLAMASISSSAQMWEDNTNISFAYLRMVSKAALLAMASSSSSVQGKWSLILQVPNLSESW